MNGSNDVDDGVMLARTGVTHPLGKCSVPVETDVPEVVAEGLIALAGITGKTRAEIQRNALIEKTLGALAVARPNGHNDLDLDAALAGLAFMANVTPDQYKQDVLFSHVFGDIAVQRLRLATHSPKHAE
jgi:hypothetical protein